MAQANKVRRTYPKRRICLKKLVLISTELVAMHVEVVSQTTRCKSTK